MPCHVEFPTNKIADGVDQIKVNCEPIRREPSSKESRDFVGNGRTVFNARSIYLNRMRSSCQSGAHNTAIAEIALILDDRFDINALGRFSQKTPRAPSSSSE